MERMSEKELNKVAALMKGPVQEFVREHTLFWDDLHKDVQGSKEDAVQVIAGKIARVDAIQAIVSKLATEFHQIPDAHKQFQDKTLKNLQDAKDRGVSAEKRLGSVVSAYGAIMQQEAIEGMILTARGNGPEGMAKMVDAQLRFWPIIHFALHEYIDEQNATEG